MPGEKAPVDNLVQFRNLQRRNRQRCIRFHRLYT